jgi:hypothetical protein
MSDEFPSSAERAKLLELAEALGCREAALRRDECGDWRVKGERGWIYAVSGSLDERGREGFQLVVMPDGEFGDPPKGSKEWAWAKKDMARFAALQNDGDGEGAVFMFRLPTAAGAAMIRDRLGIPKKREVSAAERDRLRAMGFAPSGVERREVSLEPASADGGGSLPA